MARKAPEYMIASISNYQGDHWVLEPGYVYDNRKDAEEDCAQLNADASHRDIRDARHYRVMTMTQVKRTFGQEWYNHFNEFTPDGEPIH